MSKETKDYLIADYQQWKLEPMCPPNQRGKLSCVEKTTSVYGNQLPTNGHKKDEFTRQEMVEIIGVCPGKQGNLKDSETGVEVKPIQTTVTGNGNGHRTRQDSGLEKKIFKIASKARQYGCDSLTRDDVDTIFMIYQNGVAEIGKNRLPCPEATGIRMKALLDANGIEKNGNHN